jgi:hypothetical protein
MAKRGRPTKNGAKPLWMLRRITKVLRGYQEARATGEKHSVAIKEAIRYLRSEEPWMPISDTEVRRILARWYSSKLPYGCVVVMPGPTENTLTLPGGYVFKIGLTVCMQPRVEYPRANAAQPPAQE